MRMVVDSNCLRSEELRSYLGASSKNMAVLTDQAEMEMAKADNLEGFLKSTEVLAQHPRQIILAKEVATASSLRGREKGLKKRLTDGKRTRAFRKWCRIRGDIKRRDKKFSHQQAHEGALLHMEDVLKGGANFKDDLAKHAETHFSAEDLAIIRKREKWTDAITKKVLDGISHFALMFYGLHPNWSEPPEAREVPYTFIFRYALCAYLHALHWIAVGGARERKQEKFRNDFVDVAIVAYATCFNGLITNDKLAMSIYKNAKHLLDNGFLRENLMPKRLPKAGRLQRANQSEAARCPADGQPDRNELSTAFMSHLGCLTPQGRYTRPRGRHGRGIEAT